MTRAEKVAEAQRLRAQGLTLKAIGERMGGFGVSTVQAWLSDPDLSKQRARRERYSAPCVDCGAPTDGSGGLAQPRTRCEPCKQRYQHEARYWTPERIVATIQQWTAVENGGLPPLAADWLRDRPHGCPPVVTVQRVFGSWNAGLAAAGLPTRRQGERRHGRAAA